MVHNRLVLIINFLKAQIEKILVYGAGAAWSRLFYPGVGAGADPSRSWPDRPDSGTLATWSRGRPKNWRLRNTALNSGLCVPTVELQIVDRFFFMIEFKVVCLQFPNTLK